MQSKLPLFLLLLRVFVRLSFGLVLLVGLSVGMGALAQPAHAQGIFTISDCSSDSQLQSYVAQANSDNAADVIKFSCSGDIPLSSTLNISGSMILDGNGQSVTLDGHNQVEVLSVQGGVSFTLISLTIANGSSAFDRDGGGLLNNGNMSIFDSTFANNSAGQGGALFNSTAATMSISNSTFANNSAGQGGALFNNGGGITSSGSIVANNAGGNCAGSISDQGYNLSSDSSCSFGGTSLINTDPLLDPTGLQNNGGLTQTIALQQGSPAIDTLPVSSSTCPTADQRGGRPTTRQRL